MERSKKTRDLTGPLGQSSNSTYRVWGLTGGIASGKTTVAKFFEMEGIPVIDADQIARELSQKGGRAYAPILKRFGTNDRAKLREIIFSDPQARKDLEAILHPLIREESFKQIDECAKKTGAGVFLYEATLLVETGRYKDLDGLIVVEAPEKLRKERLALRDQLDAGLIDQIFSAQTSDAERRKPATHIIENRGNLDELKKQVREWVRKLQAE